MEYKLLLPQVK